MHSGSLLLSIRFYYLFFCDCPSKNGKKDYPLLALDQLRTNLSHAGISIILLHGEDEA